MSAKSFRPGRTIWLGARLELRERDRTYNSDGADAHCDRRSLEGVPATLERRFLTLSVIWFTRMSFYECKTSFIVEVEIGGPQMATIARVLSPASGTGVDIEIVKTVVMFCCERLSPICCSKRAKSRSLALGASPGRDLEASGFLADLQVSS